MPITTQQCDQMMWTKNCQISTKIGQNGAQPEYSPNNWELLPCSWPFAYLNRFKLSESDQKHFESDQINPQKNLNVAQNGTILPNLVTLNLQATLSKPIVTEFDSDTEAFIPRKDVSVATVLWQKCEQCCK